MSHDPFPSNMSTLEADIFSGSGGYSHWPGLNLDDGILAVAQTANNNAATSSRGYGSPGGGGEGSQRKISHNAYARVAPRPRNYTERLCNPQAMLHNGRAMGLPLLRNTSIMP